VPEEGERWTVIGNVIGLCWQHHEDVTGTIGGHKAAVAYRGGVLYWIEGTDLDLVSDPGLLAIYSKTIRTRPFEGVYEAPVTEQERCPSCGRRKVRAKPEGLPKREARRKTRWQILVPQDSEEDGHALLEEAIDLAAEKQGRGEGERYYALLDALNWFNFNYDPAEDEAA